MAIFIDFLLLAIYFVTVIICYKRGFFRGLLGIAKIVFTFIGTYYLQILLSPVLDSYIPKNIKLPDAISGNFIDQIFQTLLSRFASTIVIFIAVFLIMTLLSNFILSLLEGFILTKIINRIGGLIVGLLLGVIIVIISSYIISIILLYNNSTTGIVIINESHILKIFVENNIQLLVQMISR
ncbi:MAG: CvpA family protein [Firmicutes bacterium]|nr:CvpA family protein [Bacillota bacterium]